MSRTEETIGDALDAVEELIGNDDLQSILDKTNECTHREDNTLTDAVDSLIEEYENSKDHSNLINRNLPNQHTISSITNLENVILPDPSTMTGNGKIPMFVDGEWKIQDNYAYSSELGVITPFNEDYIPPIHKIKHINGDGEMASDDLASAETGIYYLENDIDITIDGDDEPIVLLSPNFISVVSSNDTVDGIGYVITSFINNIERFNYEWIDDAFVWTHDNLLPQEEEVGELSVDTIVTPNSSNLITSGAVSNAINQAMTSVIGELDTLIGSGVIE